jgi:hypothetical protein
MGMVSTVTKVSLRLVNVAGWIMVVSTGRTLVRWTQGTRMIVRMIVRMKWKGRNLPLHPWMIFYAALK